MIKYLNQKVTANELAKLVIEDKGTVGTKFWDENCSIEVDLMTERETEAVNKAMQRQSERVSEFLGIGAIWEKRNLNSIADEYENES